MIATLATHLGHLLACATCMPDPGAQSAVAANTAIGVMLAALVFVLGSIFSFILYLMRRSRMASDAGA